MDIAIQIFMNVAEALCIALVSAGAYSLLARFMRTTRPRFGTVFKILIWSSLIGLVVGFIVASMIQHPHRSATLASIWGRILTQWLITLLAAAVFTRIDTQTRPSQLAILLPTAVTAAVLLYSISIPLLDATKAHEDRMTCAGNLIHIAGAKEHAVKMHDYHDGDVVPDSTVSELMKAGLDRSLCPAGGVYSVNPVGEDPECSVHGTLNDISSR